jgi:hypothetical protein
MKNPLLPPQDRSHCSQPKSGLVTPKPLYLTCEYPRIDQPSKPLIEEELEEFCAKAIVPTKKHITPNAARKKCCIKYRVNPLNPVARYLAHVRSMLTKRGFVLTVC